MSRPGSSALPFARQARGAAEHRCDRVDMEANMDERSKEHALEYAWFLGVGALLLAIVIINLRTHFIS
jgi:hypothetical protein